MLGWLFGAWRRASPAARQNPLNSDLAAYVHTFGMPERLREHLESQGRSGELASVQSKLDLVLADTSDFLYAQRDPIRWGSDFEQELFLYLSARHGWLNRDGFRPIRSFAGWLSWHEGLSAP
jgi:hypothetical protein